MGVTIPIQIPPLLPKCGAWGGHVPTLHVGKLRLREVRSLTSVTQQATALTVLYGSLTDLGPYKPVSPCKSNLRDRMTSPGRGAIRQKAAEAAP